MTDTQLRIGIIGAGNRCALGKHWHKPDGRSILVGFSDLLPERVDAACDRMELPRKEFFVTPDYRELLARDDVDAVAICSPDDCHEEHAIAAMEAGKHVYCEKPMAITIDACDRMMEVSKQTGRKLMVGFNMRYMAFVNKMRELVEQGAIGEVKAVWIRHFVGRGSTFYYHDWHGLKKHTTSLLLQKGSHDIDVMHYVTGKYTQRVAAFGSLDVFGGTKPNDLHCKECDERESCMDNYESLNPKRDFCAFRREIDVPDNYVTMMELEGGIKASYTECHFTPDYHRNFTFIGTEGRIENYELDHTVSLWKRANENVKEPTEVFDVNPVGEDGLLVGHGGSDEKITEAFLDMVLDNREPPVPMQAGRMSVAVGCLAQESLENGGRVCTIPALP